MLVHAAVQISSALQLHHTCVYRIVQSSQAILLQLSKIAC
jgi:hypothetical protein